MSYWGGAWNSLKFSTQSSTTSLIGSPSYRYRQGGDGVVKFRNNRAYKVTLVHVAKQMAVQMAVAEIQKLFPRYQKYLAKNLRDYMREQQDSNMTTLIENQKAQTKTNGSIDAKKNGATIGKKIVAKDKFGTPVPEALIMSYELEKPITVEDVVWDENTSESWTQKKDFFDINSTIQHKSKLKRKNSYSTTTLAHIDLAPKITMSSGKTLVTTKVQGRDYSRKELIAGDDMTFNISGSIVSDELDVYPSTAVEKLIQICKYKGIVDVNHFLFTRLGVSKVIITDFRLEHPDSRNSQPYSLSCVAIEPDEDVQIQKDTIGILNEDLKLSPMSSWVKFVLNNKLAEIAANAVASAATSAIGGLGSMIPEGDI